MKLHLLIILLFLTKSIFSQSPTILIYDLVNNTIDSISNYQIDSTLNFESTPSFIGNYNSVLTDLPTDIPTESTFPESNWTTKRVASNDYDLSTYPLRTAISIKRFRNDTIINNCSGNIISQKHVISSAHCFFDLHTNELAVDSLFVCPVFDIDMYHNSFNCSYVNKIFVYRDWSTNSEDFAILELRENIGEATGWIGIGFNNDDSLLLEGLFYKFSYPNGYFPTIDTLLYNGDSLYFSYGIIDLSGSNFLAVDNATGITGESGSTFIKQIDINNFVAYGTLTWSHNIKHSRITPKQYFGFKHIIESYSNKPNFENNEFAILTYPNPTRGQFNFIDFPHSQLDYVTIYDIFGRPVNFNHNKKPGLQFDISHLIDGIYFINLRTERINKSAKIIKRSRF